MNVQSVAGQAGRLIEDVHRQARSHFVGNSKIQEWTAGELWQETSPELERALAVYERKESADTPESTWIPFRNSKAGCQKDLDKTLDAPLVVLGACAAAGHSTRIRNLQADVTASQSRIAKYREEMLSAPSGQSQNFVEGLLVLNKEALRDQVADENDRIAGKMQQIESLKVGFREHLQSISIGASPKSADSFLLPIEDDIVSMAADICNIGHLTVQLQHLVDESNEAPSQTKRYYGMYVLLVFAVDRIQNHFVNQIDEIFTPRLRGFERDAARDMADAKAQRSRGGPKEQLTGTSKRVAEPSTPVGSWPRCYRAINVPSKMRTGKCASWPPRL
jgi:hypothetical protein